MCACALTQLSAASVQWKGLGWPLDRGGLGLQQGVEDHFSGGQLCG